jgi:hypothetical protein
MTPELEAVHHALHTLWTEAVGKPGYDKAKWMALSLAIEKALRVAEKR